jgi:hypothetical protein
MREVCVAGVSRYVPGFHPFAQSRRRSLSAAAACFAVLILFCLYSRPAAVMAGTPRPMIDRTRESSAQVVSHSLSLRRDYGYLVLAGEARNVARRDLPQLEAVVELFDEDGRLVDVESGMVKMGTIPAGDEAPFEVQAKDNPRITSYRIRYRSVTGATIPSRIDG